MLPRYVKSTSSCGNDVESREHFLLHSPQFVNVRRTLLSILGNSDYSVLENSGNVLKQTFLFGDMSLSPCDNSKILNTTIDFILATKRFDKQLFKGKLYLLTTNKEIIWQAWLFVFFQAADIYIYIYIIYYILYILYYIYNIIYI